MCRRVCQTFEPCGHVDFPTQLCRIGAEKLSEGVKPPECQVREQTSFPPSPLPSDCCPTCVGTKLGPGGKRWKGKGRMEDVKKREAASSEDLSSEKHCGKRRRLTEQNLEEQHNPG